MQLHDVLASLGGTPLGYTSASGHLHAWSKSQKGSSFVGLPLDLASQPELTEARVSAWCRQLMQELEQHEGEACHCGTGPRGPGSGLWLATAG